MKKETKKLLKSVLEVVLGILILIGFYKYIVWTNTDHDNTIPVYQPKEETVVEVVEEKEPESEEIQVEDSKETVIKVTEQPKLIVSEEPDMREGIYEKGSYDGKRVSYYRTFSKDGVVVIFIFEDEYLDRLIANREDIEVIDYTISETAEPKINLKIEGKEYIADINADISYSIDENGNMSRGYNLMEK